MAYDLKNEEEVKEFIENLGIEYRFGCFSEKNPEVCHLLGDYLEGIKKDYRKAAKIYKSNCDDYNYGRSCNAFGVYALLGRGSEKGDSDLALKYFTRGCDLNIASACFHGGSVEVAPNVDLKKGKDYTAGIAMLDKGCNMDYEPACFALSGLYISGSKDKVLPKNMELAFKYSSKACDLGNMYACSNLSLMYQKGEGVEINEEMAKKFKRKALSIKSEMTSNITLEFSRGSEES